MCGRRALSCIHLSFWSELGGGSQTQKSSWLKSSWSGQLSSICEPLWLVQNKARCLMQHLSNQFSLPTSYTRVQLECWFHFWFQLLAVLQPGRQWVMALLLEFLLPTYEAHAVCQVPSFVCSQAWLVWTFEEWIRMKELSFCQLFLLLLLHVQLHFWKTVSNNTG